MRKKYYIQPKKCKKYHAVPVPKKIVGVADYLHTAVGHEEVENNRLKVVKSGR
jgi:hypothetical protein